MIRFSRGDLARLRLSDTRHGPSPVSPAWRSVLDASAALALQHQERGAEVVGAAVAAGGAVLSAVNAAEVATKGAERGLDPLDTLLRLRRYGLDFTDYGFTDAAVTGFLRELTRKAGLSLGDRSCLALALRLRAPVYTADRPWERFARPLGLRIVVIR